MRSRSGSGGPTPGARRKVAWGFLRGSRVQGPCWSVEDHVGRFFFSFSNQVGHQGVASVSLSRTLIFSSVNDGVVFRLMTGSPSGPGQRDPAWERGVEGSARGRPGRSASGQGPAGDAEGSVLRQLALVHLGPGGPHWGRTARGGLQLRALLSAKLAHPADGAFMAFGDSRQEDHHEFSPARGPWGRARPFWRHQLPIWHRRRPAGRASLVTQGWEPTVERRGNRATAQFVVDAPAAGPARKARGPARVMGGGGVRRREGTEPRVAPSVRSSGPARSGGKGAEIRKGSSLSGLWADLRNGTFLRGGTGRTGSSTNPGAPRRAGGSPRKGRGFGLRRPAADCACHRALIGRAGGIGLQAFAGERRGSRNNPGPFKTSALDDVLQEAAARFFPFATIVELG